MILGLGAYLKGIEEKFKNKGHTMKKSKIQNLSLIFVVGLFILIFYVDAHPEQEIKLLMRVDGYIDGHQSVKCFILDPQTGQYQAITLEKGGRRFPQAVQLQSAVLTRSWHWAWSKKLIKFGTTPDSKPHKQKFKKIIKAYHNNRRGNNNVPRMKMSTKVIKVTPIWEFEDKSKFYTQLDFDGNSTAVATDDNQFFKDQNGNFYDPSVMTKTKILATLYVKQQANRQVGTHRIEESDVYFRSEFFNQAKKIYERLATAAFKLALGYKITVWSHDLLSNKDHHADRDFQPINSDLWIKTIFERDDFYYMDKLSGLSVTDYLDKPRILPFEDEVIDIGDYELPEVIDGHIDLDKTHILFLTSLKGFDGDKKMIIKIWRVIQINPLKQELIVKLQGNTLDYPQNIGNNTLVYPSIFLNNVRLGIESDLNKLKNAVNDHGTLQILDGVLFAKALRIRVKITGYLAENGKVKNKSRFFWLVDTKN